MKRTVLYILPLMLLLLAQQVMAHQLFTRSFFPGYKIDGKKISCMTENPEGFVFIGTLGAVYLFDGLSYTALPFPDSLRHAEVTVVQTCNMKLYAGLNNGSVLCWEELRTMKPARFITDTEAAVTDIELQEDILWVSTYGQGLFSIMDSQEQTGSTKLSSLPDDFIYDLQRDDAGNLWAGTDAGLVKITRQSDGIRVQVIDQTNGLPDLIVTRLHLDTQNILWLGFHDGGFCSYDIDHEKLIQYAAADGWDKGPVTGLLEIDDYLWISSATHGIIAFQLSNEQLMCWPATEDQDLPERSIALVKSQLRGFWVAGNDRLVWTAGRQMELFASIGGFTTKATTAILVDRKGRLWWSTETGVFMTENLIEGHSKVVQLKPGATSGGFFASCLYEDIYGVIWMGTLDKGVFAYDPNAKSWKNYTENDGLINNNILSISGKGNDIWFATLGGASLAKLQPDHSLRFESQEVKMLGSNYIYAILTDSRGRVWFATDGNGIQMLDKGKLIEVLPDSLHNEVFYTLTEAADSAIWMASPGKGLLRWSSDGLQSFTTNQGLSSNTITSLLQTNTPYLLAVGYDGFDLIKVWDQTIFHGSNHYGLPAAQSGLGVITSNNEGVVFIGTNEGILRLESISDLANRKPLLRLRLLTANLEALDFEAPLRLKHDQRQISISYAGLWYPQPEQLRFEVTLTGQESTQFETRDQTLHFGNLQPGSYSVEIHEKDSVTADKGILLKFFIQMPWWQQWWVIAMAVLGMLAFIVGWMRQRERKINARQQILREKSEFEYRNLRSQVNPHFLFNSFSTLIALIEEQGGEAIGYVEKLSDFFRQILEYRDATLITLEEEMKLLETYLFLQKKRYGSSFVTEIHSCEAIRDSKIPPMTLQMLAENALKHNVASKSKPLLLKIDCTENEIIVTNRIQTKTTTEASTGLGLQNITERYRLFACKTPVFEKTNETFRVVLPLIR
ncbi:MAG: hypothetical protein FD155_2819 [Bacteroidetes bacterium]|nr:MAG: hypothetical protein FD155_2819 [Bacteroidota bacterium]